MKKILMSALVWSLPLLAETKTETYLQTQKAKTEAAQAVQAADAVKARWTQADQKATSLKQAAETLRQSIELLQNELLALQKDAVAKEAQARQIDSQTLPAAVGKLRALNSDREKLLKDAALAAKETEKLLAELDVQQEQLANALAQKKKFQSGEIPRRYTAVVVSPSSRKRFDATAATQEEALQAAMEKGLQHYGDCVLEKMDLAQDFVEQRDKQLADSHRQSRLIQEVLVPRLEKQLAASTKTLETFRTRQQALAQNSEALRTEIAQLRTSRATLLVELKNCKIQEVSKNERLKDLGSESLVAKADCERAGKALAQVNEELARATKTVADKQQVQAKLELSLNQVLEEIKLQAKASGQRHAQTVLETKVAELSKQGAVPAALAQGKQAASAYIDELQKRMGYQKGYQQADKTSSFYLDGLAEGKKKSAAVVRPATAVRTYNAELKKRWAAQLTELPEIDFRTWGKKIPQTISNTQAIVEHAESGDVGALDPASAVRHPAYLEKLDESTLKRIPSPAALTAPPTEEIRALLPKTFEEQGHPVLDQAFRAALEQGFIETFEAQVAARLQQFAAKDTADAFQKGWDEQIQLHQPLKENAETWQQGLYDRGVTDGMQQELQQGTTEATEAGIADLQKELDANVLLSAEIQAVNVYTKAVTDKGWATPGDRQAVDLRVKNFGTREIAAGTVAAKVVATNGTTLAIENLPAIAANSVLTIKNFHSKRLPPGGSLHWNVKVYHQTSSGDQVLATKEVILKAGDLEDVFHFRKATMEKVDNANTILNLPVDASMAKLADLPPSEWHFVTKHNNPQTDKIRWEKSADGLLLKIPFSVDKSFGGNVTRFWQVGWGLSEGENPELPEIQYSAFGLQPQMEMFICFASSQDVQTCRLEDVKEKFYTAEIDVTGRSPLHMTAHVMAEAKESQFWDTMNLKFVSSLPQGISVVEKSCVNPRVQPKKGDVIRCKMTFQITEQAKIAAKGKRVEVGFELFGDHNLMQHMAIPVVLK